MPPAPRARTCAAECGGRSRRAHRYVGETFPACRPLRRCRGCYRDAGRPWPATPSPLHRYGAELPDVLAPAAGDPALGRPVDHTAGYLPVEVLYAVTHEGALTLDDVLTRRTHVA